MEEEKFKVEAKDRKFKIILGAELYQNEDALKFMKIKKKKTKEYNEVSKKPRKSTAKVQAKKNRSVTFEQNK